MHAALLAALLAAAPSQTAPPSSPLAEALRAAVAAADLGDLVDAGPDAGACPGSPWCPLLLPGIAAAPTVDLAVIRLDADGRALDAAEVIVDATSPDGWVVPLGADRAPRGLRLRRWSPERSEAGLDAAPFEEADDVVPGRPPRRPARDFMSPYPASVFKLLVAFHVARRAAQGALPLDLPIADGPGPEAQVRTVAAWLDRMMTVSDNVATRALLRWLHARGEVERMNRDLAALGLVTLRVDGTRPEDGTRWAPGEIHAGAMDLARLLWLVEGGPGILWRVPGGRAVTRNDLPEPARALLLGLLDDQARHEILSRGTTCGSTPSGIPARVPERWIDPATGSEAAVDPAFQRDVRPCNAAAEVRFLHKTGLTWNYASDAGIVESLPGAPFRRYVVALVSTLGLRYLDPERRADARHPCDAEGLCVSGRVAAIGAALDAWMARTAGGAPAR